MKGNYENFRLINGLSQEFDICEYEGRHARMWYNPETNQNYIAIEFENKQKVVVCDVVQSSAIKPKIHFIPLNPPEYQIINITEIRDNVLKIVKFIYAMDNNRMSELDIL
ncbi:MAG: hypothetical protein ACI4TV_03945 [Paludibacteraceae bacterium]